MRRHDCMLQKRCDPGAAKRALWVRDHTAFVEGLFWRWAGRCYGAGLHPHLPGRHNRLSDMASSTLTSRSSRRRIAAAGSAQATVNAALDRLPAAQLNSGR